MWAAVLLVADASVIAQSVAKYSYIKGDGIRFIAVTILICQRMRRVHRGWVDCLLLPDCISAYCAPAVPQRIVAFSVAHSPSECAEVRRHVGVSSGRSASLVPSCATTLVARTSSAAVRPLRTYSPPPAVRAPSPSLHTRFDRSTRDFGQSRFAKFIHKRLAARDEARQRSGLPGGHRRRCFAMRRRLPVGRPQ